MPTVQSYLLGKATTVQAETLPLVHTANGEDFLSILNAKQIIPHRCRVFDGEKLSYFFLGRAAYKTDVAIDAYYWQLPAIFVFHNAPSIPITRVFPFDSGAMKDNRYRDIIGQIDISHFELDRDWASMSAAIEFYFSNCENYLSGQARPYQDIRDDVGDQTSNFPVLALSKLYNYQFNEMIDDRVRLIEIQYSDPIELNNDNLKGVIICNEWLRDKNIRSILESIGCCVRSYPIYPLSSANYYSKIYELAEDFR